MKTTFQTAFKIFSDTLRKDKGLYIAYHANIAMAYVDNGRWLGSRDSFRMRHKIGNAAAKYFLDLLLKKPSKKLKNNHGKKSLK